MCVLYRSLYYYKSEAGTGCAGQPTITDGSTSWTTGTIASVLGSKRHFIDMLGCWGLQKQVISSFL